MARRLGPWILLFLVLLGWLSVFTVNLTQKAILLQLGEIKRADLRPGLHFKLPFIQNVLRFDAKLQNLDSAPQLYLTSEKKNVKVDWFAKWRIGNVVEFYKTTGGSLLRANDRLSDIVQKRLKDEFGKRTLQEVVSGQRAEIMQIVSRSTRKQAAGLGIDVIDVRIKRVDLPEDVAASVYRRMAAERTEVAKQFRSRGEQAARIIRATADKQRVVIIADAERDAQKLRGQGEAKAAEIYAKAYAQDPEFYSFYRSLGAYRQALAKRSDMLVIKPDSEFFRYFNGLHPGSAAPGKP